MGWRNVSPNCIVGAKRRFDHVARNESWAMFNFWSFGGSVSQSNHTPVQALANQTACLCVLGGRFMWLVVGRVSAPPCRQATTHAAVWTGRERPRDPIGNESWAGARSTGHAVDHFRHLEPVNTNMKYTSGILVPYSRTSISCYFLSDLITHLFTAQFCSCTSTCLHREYQLWCVAFPCCSLITHPNLHTFQQQATGQWRERNNTYFVH